MTLSHVPMSVNNSLNVFDDIQTLCRDFRRQLKTGDSGKIEVCPEKVGDSPRDMLFQNLLIEVESVIPHAETWSLGDEYDARCVATQPDLR